MLPFAMIALCVVLRVLPHPPNMTITGATAVMGGRTMPRMLAIATVLVAMFMSDALLAWWRGYPLVSWVTPFVYAGFAIQALLGHALRKVRFGSVGAAFLGACAFFVLSNLGVWATGNFYTHDGAGLAICFSKALPFFGWTVLGDVGFTVALSLAYAALARESSSRRWLLVPADRVAPI